MQGPPYPGAYPGYPPAAPYGGAPAPYAQQPYGAPPQPSYSHNPYGASLPSNPYGQAAPAYPYGQPPAAQPPGQPYGAPPQSSSHSSSYPQPGAPSQSASSSYPSINASNDLMFGGLSGNSNSQPSQGPPNRAYDPAPSAPSAPSAPPGPAAPQPGAYPGHSQQAPPGAYGQPPTSAGTYGQPPSNAPYPSQPSAPYQTQLGAQPQYQPQPAAQPQYQPPTTYSPAPGHGQRRKRAVLVGCGYPGTQTALNGCLNDIKCMDFLLKKHFGFQDSSILTLRDDIRDVHFTSTKQNIYKGIQWLMTDLRPGDSLFFHFSGHGSQKRDMSGDEEDGYDETILPTDYKAAGQIVDDELNYMLVRPLTPNVTLHCVVDACHSGTVMDLPYRTKVDRSGRFYWKGHPRGDKITAGGTAFQFGACKDHQVAQDTNRLSGKTFTGAATFCFIEAIEKYGTTQTYAQLLMHMMGALEAATGKAGMKIGGATALMADLFLGGAASMLTQGGQTPVLCCDKQIDLASTRLML